MKCKMIKKLVLMGLTLSLLSGCKTDKSQIENKNAQISKAEETATDATENDSSNVVYNAYADYLSNNSLYEGFEPGVYETDETQLAFSLVYIDEDDIPELIVGWTKTLATSSDICILKYIDGEVVCSGPIGHYNHIGYIPRKNVLMENNYNLGICYYWYGYLNENGEISTHCESYEECPEGESLGFTYYVKGEEVSELEYNNYYDSVINGEFAYWSGHQSSNITYLLNADSLERLRNGDVEVDVTIEELENSLIDNPSSVDLASLYDDIETCDYAENFEGKWSSPDLTDVHYGELTITQQDSDGFYFDGDFLYHHGEYPFTDDGPNTGDAIGYAHFINNHLAISRNIIDIDGFDGYDGYAVFYLYNNHLYIWTTGIVGWMGGGVYMDGEYVIN